MVTIRDVAKLSGFSTTTVSIVINGKAKERRIPQATQDSIYSAMRELDYQPDLSARRLRSNELRKPIIAFFWPLDYRSHILASLLNGIQCELNRQEFDCELMVQTYEDGKLELSASGLIQNNYSAAIIGACSEQDQAFLEQLELHIPLVLINRNSDVYSTVCVDTNRIAIQAADLFLQKGYSATTVMTSVHPYFATGRRTKAFIHACNELDIEIQPEWIIQAPNTIQGGAQAAEQYCALQNLPKVIFCESDSMALGAVYTFHKKGIHVPNDVEILAIGMLSEETTAYSVPSISVITMGNDKAAAETISIVIYLLHSKDKSAIHKTIQSEILFRESFCIDHYSS